MVSIYDEMSLNATPAILFLSRTEFKKSLLFLVNFPLAERLAIFAASAILLLSCCRPQCDSVFNLTFDWLSNVSLAALPRIQMLHCKVYCHVSYSRLFESCQ